MDYAPRKYYVLLICLVLTLATTVVFCQVCTYDFVNYDDPLYVYENPNIQAGITLKTIKWAFTTSHVSNWHPLTWLSHMLDWRLFGYNPAGHHLTNLVFHIANTLLLFIVLKRMTNTLWPSAFVAALFALHPLHVESVTWVSERKDVLSTFFWMLTMWAYVRFVSRPKIASYLLVALFLALGLMAKPMLVTLPFVLLLLDYWPLDRFSLTVGPKCRNAHTKYSLSYLLIEKCPLFAMALISCIVTFIAQKKGGAVVTTEYYNFSVRLANAFISYLQYINKMIWPARLAIFYPHPGRDVSILNAVISAVLLLTVTILIFRFARDHRYLVTGWLWYLGTLVPVVGLIQVGAQAMADRYSYITLTGLFIIIAFGLPDLLAKWRYKKVALVSSALLIILAISICTHFQIQYWRNSLTIFQHAIDVTEDNYVAHFCIAKSLREQGRFDEAVSECQKCLQVTPYDPYALNALGVVFSQQGKFDEAVKYFTEALRIKPDFAAAYTNIGYALALQGNLDEATVHLTEALRLDPHFAQAHYYLGQTLVQRGKINETITHFEEALRLNPDWVEPMNDLAWFLAASKEATIHNPDKAIRLAQRAAELTKYENATILDTLAVAYASAGKFSKAVETAEKALELAQSSQKRQLAEDIQNRLLLFKAGRPYIENSEMIKP